MAKSPNSLPRIELGIASNKTQLPEWWGPLLNELLRIQRVQFDICALNRASGALVSKNRNTIAHMFRQGDADALWMIDDDTEPPSGALARLWNLGSDIAAGIYYLRGAPYNPVIYRRWVNGRYIPLTQFVTGEIIEQSQGVGMGCTLIRRHVFEEIENNYHVFQRAETGTLKPIHKDDVLEIENDALPDVVHDNAAKIVMGYGTRGYHIEPVIGPLPAKYRTRKTQSYGANIWIADVGYTEFPFYTMEHGRTEDYPFCEMALRCGFNILVDTWIECKHWGTVAVGRKDFDKAMRERNRRWREEEELSCES